MALNENWCVAPYFLVEDVAAAANFYRDKLGFRYDRFWGDPPSFCMVRRGGIVLMLSQNRKDALRPNTLVDGQWDAYIWVEDATAVRDEFKATGVPIDRDLCDQEYGCRDFEIVDSSGYRLCFGQDLG